MREFDPSWIGRGENPCALHHHIPSPTIKCRHLFIGSDSVKKTGNDQGDAIWKGHRIPVHVGVPRETWSDWEAWPETVWRGVCAVHHRLSNHHEVSLFASSPSPFGYFRSINDQIWLCLQELCEAAVAVVWKGGRISLDGCGLTDHCARGDAVLEPEQRGKGPRNERTVEAAGNRAVEGRKTGRGSPDAVCHEEVLGQDRGLQKPTGPRAAPWRDLATTIWMTKLEDSFKNWRNEKKVWKESPATQQGFLSPVIFHPFLFYSLS